MAIKKTWNTPTEYVKKLQDPRWQRKRLEILQRDNFKCTNCSDDKNTLHVHHTYYATDNPWESENLHLITLCSDCHESEEICLKEEAYNVVSYFKQDGFMASDFRYLYDTFRVKKNFSEDLDNFDKLSICLEDEEIWRLATEKLAEKRRLHEEFLNTPEQIEKREKALIEFEKHFGSW